MDDTKRMLVGFVVIMLFLMIFQYYFAPKQKNAEPEVTTEQVAKEQAQQEENQRLEIKPDEIVTEKDESLSELLSGKEKEEETSAETVKISTNFMDAYLSTRGGVIDSVYLKNYGVMFFALDRSEPLLSTSIITSKRTVSTRPINFNVKVEDGDSEKRVIFSYMLDTVSVTKIYTFYDSSYIVDLECLPKSEYMYEITTFDTGEEFSREAHYSGVVYSAGGKSYTINKGDLFKGENEDVSGAIEWIGYKTKYFFGGVVSKEYLDEFTMLKSPDAPVISIQDEYNTSIYFGPLKFSVLASVKEGFEDAIYFGWPILRPVAKFIYHFMQFLHRYVDNYGLVIILFVVCLVLILSPLTLHQTKSMSKMKELQPRMQEIKKKYKDDPQRINQETMKMYRETGFNPFSSCLPMFLQMPIFFSLFQVLNSSIELKGAPFILWIQDLSVKDPYYILPVLTGISMFLQQKIMAPANQDDQQKIMSYMMPAFITFIFLTLPSGLTLYFFTYNILMLIVQNIIKKRAKED
jgi:YidC/Oxa1 family membrane protein insertase